MDTRKCHDCGGGPSNHSGGWARLRDQIVICWGCAAKRERAAQKKTKPLK